MLNLRFRCDRCGLCCRHISNVPQLSEFDRGDGVCRHLTGENLCDIYDSRPEVCSVDRMYSRFSATMSREEYEDMMLAACAVLKRNYGAIRSADLPRDQRSEALCADLRNLTANLDRETLSSFARELNVSMPEKVAGGFGGS